MLNADIEACEEVGEGRVGNKKILSGNCNYRHTILSGIVGNNKGGCSFRGVYMRNIADIIPNGSDICSNADIPELYEIASQ